MEKKASKMSGKKVQAFLKKNVYYILMVLCVLAIGAMITAAAVINSKPDVDVNVPAPGPSGGDDVFIPDDGGVEQPVVTEPKFELKIPFAGAVEGLTFDDANLVLNGDGKWKTHLGLDLHADAGTKVVASFDGVVESITNDIVNGTVVTLSHKNGYKSVYKMLGDNVGVKVGANVIKGEQIGEVGNIDGSPEAKLGTHLHLEVLKNGVQVNPKDYFEGSGK